MTIIKSLSRDPAWNLFIEQELAQWTGELCAPDEQDTQYKQIGPAGLLLLFYINSPSVIVGRNQSVEAEVDVAWCGARGIPVLRRISGGGAVWHDEGNINYSFITSKHEASPLDDNPHASIVIAALKGMGVEAAAGPRRELLVRGLKISGTASCQRRGMCIFHGTLLHRTDLDSMQRALSGNPAARGRKVASVPGRVMNLSFLPEADIPTEKFLDGFIATLWKQSCRQQSGDTSALRR